MDINFHYYAVKTIAAFAGFSEEDAQVIAEYSQFVDDYNVYSACFVKNVDQRWVDSGIVTSQDDGYVFNPIQTGFIGLGDMINLCSVDYQVRITVPFHFIPVEKINKQRINDNKETRERLTTQAFDYDGNADSIMPIFVLLRNAREKFQNAELNSREYTESLIRIGAVLHVFADTFAHHGFSGLQGYENYGYITKCVNIADERKDYTYSQQYKGYIIPFSQLAAIGHAEFNHAPDMTYAKYSWKKSANSQQKSTKQYTIVSSRNNSLEFLRAAESIYKYLLHCRAGDAETDTIKILSLPIYLQNILITGFSYEYNADEPDIDKLNEVWTQAFEDCNYHYKRKELLDDQMHPSKERDTYDYIGLEDFEFGDVTQYDIENYANGLKFDSIDDDLFAFNLAAKEILTEAVDLSTFKQARNPLLDE